MVFPLKALSKIKELTWHLKYRRFDIIFPEQFYKSETNCTCAVPCERVVYEPKLSYAQLSQLNIQRFVAGSNNQQEEFPDQKDQYAAGSLDQLTVMGSTVFLSLDNL